MHDLAQMTGTLDQFREGIHAFAYVIFSAYENLSQQRHSEQLDSVKEFFAKTLDETKESVQREIHAVQSDLQKSLAESIKELKKSSQHATNMSPNTYAQALLSQT